MHMPEDAKIVFEKCYVHHSDIFILSLSFNNISSQEMATSYFA